MFNSSTNAGYKNSLLLIAALVVVNTISLSWITIYYLITTFYTYLFYFAHCLCLNLLTSSTCFKELICYFYIANHKN